LYVLPELLDPEEKPLLPDDLPPPALASAAVSRITHERKNTAIPRTRTPNILFHFVFIFHLPLI
jgi:hypothetical protein